jgi:hypothetical protein
MQQLGSLACTAALISAPERYCAVYWDLTGPADDSEFSYYLLQVESGNRSCCLIRHLGMLLVNFPRLNGVFSASRGRKNGIRI